MDGGDGMRGCVSAGSGDMVVDGPVVVGLGRKAVLDKEAEEIGGIGILVG